MTENNAAATVAAIATALRAQGHAASDSYSTDWEHYFGHATIVATVEGFGEVWVTLMRRTGSLRMQGTTACGAFYDHRDDASWVRPDAMADSIANALGRWMRRAA